MKDVVDVYTDGGSRGNPGPAAAGFVVIMNKNTIQKSGKYLGVKTNNEAEYAALLMALEWLISQKYSETSAINFYLDSQLIVNQIKGSYKVKSPKIRLMFKKVSKLLEHFVVGYQFFHIRRDKNKEADFIVNQYLDKCL